MRMLKLVNLHIVLFFGAVLIICSCEEEIQIEQRDDAKEIVVEGYIESGSNSLPPYVLLSYSFPFFNQLTVEEFLTNSIKEAQVTVEKNEVRYPLDQVCLKDLPDAVKVEFAKSLGVPPELLSELDFCVYIDLSRKIPIEEGATYDLEVAVDKDTLYARTVIPMHIPLDSLYFVPVQGLDTSYREMKVRLVPPGGLHYYRYLVDINNRGFISPERSVFSDKIFDDEGFDFRLPRPAPKDSKPGDPTRFLYEIGDSIVLKWCTIGESHFDFWRTLEYNRQNQGPFSSYTRVQSNITGGIGIWGGCSYTLYKRVVR